MTHSNIDPLEIAKFDDAASSWWDTEGELKTLHEINPLRMRYINERINLAGKKVVDIGCGGGILSESLAKAGAKVTAIDMAAEALEVAKQHAQKEQLDIDYRCITAETLAAEETEQYDVVTCMEMLEHVPDPTTIVQACAKLCKPGGQLFFSTINRNPKSFLLAIVAAEHIMRLVPKGTHEYAKFIKPSELAEWSRAAELDVCDVSGILYNPITHHHRLNKDVDVNYLMHLTK